MQTIVVSQSRKEKSPDVHVRNGIENNKKDQEIIEMQTLGVDNCQSEQEEKDAEIGNGLESIVANQIFLSVAKEALDSYYKSRQSYCKDPLIV